MAACSDAGVPCKHSEHLDESQLEVNKESVSFRRFKTEEEAKEFKDAMTSQGEAWSDITDSPKGGVFVAYCRGGELALEAVNEAGRDYGMAVDLTAGYVVGRTWKECH